MTVQIYEYRPEKNVLFYATFGLIGRTQSADFSASQTSFTLSGYYDDSQAGTPFSFTPAASIAEIGTGGTGLYGIKMQAAEMNHTLVMLKIENANVYDTLLVFRPIDVAAENNRMADFFYRRSTVNVEASAHTGLDALSYQSGYGLVATAAHRWYPSGGNLIFTKADGVTTLATRPAGTDGNAIQLTSMGVAT